MRKPKAWGHPCPNPNCSYYRLINRGNVSAIATYLTQSGKRRIFRCGKCAGTFSETRDTVFFDLRTPEEKVMMALKMLLVKVAEGHWLCLGRDRSHRPGMAAASRPEGA